MSKGRVDLISKAVVPFIILCLVALAFYSFQMTNYAMVQERNSETLRETVIQKNETVSKIFGEYLEMIGMLSYFYRDSLSNADGIPAVLADMEKNSGFDFVHYANSEGLCVSSEARMADVSGRDFWKEGMAGESGICDVIATHHGNGIMIGFHTPVISPSGESVEGVLVGFFSQEKLSRLLAGQIFGYSLESHIISSSLTVIGSTDSSMPGGKLDDILDEKICRSIREGMNGLEPGMVMKLSGYSEYSEMLLSRLGKGDYYLVADIPEEAVLAVTRKMARGGNILFASLLGILLLATGYVFILWWLSYGRGKAERSIIIRALGEDNDIVLSLDPDSKMVKVVKGGSFLTDIFPPENGTAFFPVLMGNLGAHLTDGGSLVTVQYEMDRALDNLLYGDGKPGVLVMSLASEKGEEFVQMKLRLSPGKGNRIVISLRVVTDLVKKEMEDNKRLSDALEKSNAAIRAKGTFLANVSHDLRTPMNAIMGYTNLCMAHSDEKEISKEYLSKIDEASKHLLALLNDILDMSQIEGNKVVIEKQYISLRDVIDSLNVIIEVSLETKSQNYTVNVDALEHDEVLTDKVRLKQVILNCLTNAVKYTQEGGDIALEIVEREGDGKNCGIFEFHVRDNGIGMSEDFLECIWEPFERERNSTLSGIQGTGLGMSITKNLVELLGGKISVTSKLGEGSEFIISIPMEFREDDDEHLLHWQGRSAIVIGDTKFGKSVASMLSRIKLIPVVVPGSQDALAMTDVPGAVFIDRSVVDREGFCGIRKLRSVFSSPEIPFVLLSYRLMDIEEEAIGAGVDAFCPRPVFVSDIRTLLEEKIPGAVYRSKEEMDLRGLKVLVVDDNELNRDIAYQILTDAGMIVSLANDGYSAVEDVEKGGYDIVFMDVQMPGIDGYESARRIRALPDVKKSRTPIFSMTANAFPSDRAKAFDAGMNGHIPKPIELEILINEISSIF